MSGTNGFHANGFHPLTPRAKPEPVLRRIGSYPVAGLSPLTLIEWWDIPGLGTRWVASRGGHFLSATGYDLNDIDGASHHATPEDAARAAFGYAMRMEAERPGLAPPETVPSVGLPGMPSLTFDGTQPEPSRIVMSGYLATKRPTRPLASLPAGDMVFRPAGIEGPSYRILESSRGVWLVELEGHGFLNRQGTVVSSDRAGIWPNAGEAWAAAQAHASRPYLLDTLDRLTTLVESVQAGKVTLEICRGDREGETVAIFRRVGETT